MRRSSRYQRAQARRAEQRASDNKFYRGMFALIGVVVMFALLIAAIATNGGQVDVSSLDSWMKPWALGMSKMEIAGFVLVGLIAAVMYTRMRKK